MAISYEKLWKLLDDRHITRTQLCHEAKLTTNSIANMGKGKHVSTEVLSKICNHLDCTMNDIVDLTPESRKK